MCARVRLARSLLPAAWLVLAGCSVEPNLGEVEGTVRKDGEPLSGVSVMFVPDPVKGMSDGRASSAVTDDAGRYVLQFGDQVKPRPGAIVGTHKVTVTDIAWENARDDPKRGRPRVPAVYLSSGSSPLAVEVKPGKQSIDVEIK